MTLEDQKFTLTDEHITLLRAMYVGWCDDEFGAPEIDPKRPYGNSDVEYDMAVLLGVPVTDDGEIADTIYAPTGEPAIEALRRLHAETKTALRVVLSVGAFESGVYRSDWMGHDWEREDA